jgi:hypothetical protein
MRYAALNTEMGFPPRFGDFVSSIEHNRTLPTNPKAPGGGRYSEGFQIVYVIFSPGFHPRRIRSQFFATFIGFFPNQE